METLCTSCVHVRTVVSGTGSQFLLCRLSQSNKHFPKYPPQPVVRCHAYEDKTIAAKSLTLEVVPGRFATCPLDPQAGLPDWATGEVVSGTRPSNKLSPTGRGTAALSFSGT